jgi:16S rRNA G966 N2-methylase RsmD
MTGVAALRTQRIPILIDLSPAATFVAYNFLTPIDARHYFSAVESILSSLQGEELKLYGTHCRDCGKLVPMEYLVWSYKLACESCQQEFVLWDVARAEREDVRQSKILTEFDCPHCGKHLQKRKLRRSHLVPVQVGYRCCHSGSQESKAIPDEFDLRVIGASDSGVALDSLWYPTHKLPSGVNTRQAVAHGFDSVNALYTTRNLKAVARLWDIARRWEDRDASLKLMFTVTSLYQRVTRLSEFRFWGGSGNIANYNVPMIFNEQNVFKVFRRKAKTIRDYLETFGAQPTAPFCISTQSATDLSNIPDGSIDYIFTDPPFGGNINYSEMNFLWEAWLGVFTDTKEEAVINRVQGKAIGEYQELMTRALRELYRVLKPGRWLTIEFHNSSAHVWSAIQAALAASGFALEEIQTLDKRHGTFKQFVSENAVGYDLILHCTKGTSSLNGSRVSRSHMVSTKELDAFFEKTIKQHPEGFIVRYLHVDRPNELDSRKLYSLWVKERIERSNTVDLDYDEFRQKLGHYLQTAVADGLLSEIGGLDAIP